jgi:DNA-binding NarL/FixJ family response regulator
LNDLPSTLTPSERDIAQKLLLGLSPKKISELRFTALRTTRFHIVNIYAKSGVHKRSEFMVKYLGEAELKSIQFGRKLSEREQEVFNLTVDGFCNKEIACKLNVVENTIKFHLTNIFKVCRAKNRIDLIEQHFGKQKLITKSIINAIKEENEQASKHNLLPIGKS